MGNHHLLAHLQNINLELILGWQKPDKTDMAGKWAPGFSRQLGIGMLAPFARTSKSR